MKKSENSIIRDYAILDDYLNSISTKKRQKVINFVIDYFSVLEQLVRVLKSGKYIILTLGDRRVDNKVVPLSRLTQEYFERNGFVLKKTIVRNITKKRMPLKLSKVGKKSVDSMNKEIVLIMKKI